MSPVTFDLPWPAQALHPNARPGHWGPVARARRDQRQAAFYIARGSLPVNFRAPEGRIDVGIDFLPPDRRRRDVDGMLASLKSGLDGIADAMRVDDSRFRITFALTEPTKGGKVRITVGRAA